MSMVNTNAFFDFTDFTAFQVLRRARHGLVSDSGTSLVVIHVGGPRCGTSSTDNIMNRHDHVDC